MSAPRREHHQADRGCPGTFDTSPMIVGYARTCSLAQVAGLEAQERDLRAAGCEKIFSEQVSSVAERQQLEAAFDYDAKGTNSLVRNWTGLHGRLATCWRSSPGSKPSALASVRPSEIASRLGIGRASVYRVLGGGDQVLALSAPWIQRSISQHAPGFGRQNGTQ
jgi:hypothetical protein